MAKIKDATAKPVPRKKKTVPEAAKKKNSNKGTTGDRLITGDDLTIKQLAFVHKFIEQDFTRGTEAYFQAYGREMAMSSAAASATNLLKLPKVQAYISKAIAEHLKEQKGYIERRIFDVWVKRAFYDPSEIVTADGVLVAPMEELKKKGLTVCIEGVEQRVGKAGPYAIIKLCDREKALDMLQRYIAMIKEQPLVQINKTGEITADDEAYLQALLRERAELDRKLK